MNSICKKWKKKCLQSFTIGEQIEYRLRLYAL
jgi:hypothetical protein